MKDWFKEWVPLMIAVPLIVVWIGEAVLGRHPDLTLIGISVPLVAAWSTADRESQRRRRRRQRRHDPADRDETSSSNEEDDEWNS